LGPVLASAVETLLPSLARVLESVTELASNALPPLAALVSDVLVVGIAAAAPVLDVAAAAIGLLADNTWVLVPALSAIAAVKLADIASGWAGALGGAIGPIRDAATHFGRLRAEGEGVFTAMRNAGREAGGAAGTLAGAL